MSEPRNCIVLGDGTVLADATSGFSGRNLWSWICGKTFQECVELFDSLVRTQRLECRFNTYGVRYTGFTELSEVKRGTDALGRPNIGVCLTWPDGGEHLIEEFQIPKDVA